MVLKNFFAGVAALILFVSAKADIRFEKGLPFADQPQFSDSTGIGDSLKQDIPVADPKQEFRAFFASNTQSSGIYSSDLNPEMTSFVENYVDRNGKKLEDIRDRNGRYFDIMDGIFEQHNLPKELKYLAVIESELKTNARSHAGAVGPWQFMAGTARGLGLRVGKKYDERRDFIKSTHAACRYLTDLYAIYEDWLLVIAAYNSGPGKVNSAIRKSGSHNFWALQRFLPAESKSHVKKFIATHYFMEGQTAIAAVSDNESNETPADENSQNESTDGATSQLISGRYFSFVIMKYISIDIATFNRLNPGFDKTIATNGSYELHLPAEKMTLFLSHKSEILNESLQVLLKQNTASN